MITEIKLFGCVFELTPSRGLRLNKDLTNLISKHEQDRSHLSLKSSMHT